MNPFLLGRDERLVEWKAFRLSLAELCPDEQFIAVARYWAQAPMLARPAYDVENCKELPTPWEMIITNDWCRDSVAVGMEFTLRLAGYPAEELSLSLIRDYDISEQMFCLKIDNRLLLNYSIGEVKELPSTNHFCLMQIRYNGRGYLQF